MIREKQQKTLVYIFRVRFKGFQKPFQRKKKILLAFENEQIASEEDIN